jgi:septal ring factor EnvC (AmiA/AmiB activator)
MSVRFLVTDLEQQKRENHKNYLSQLTNYKKNLNVINKEKETLEKTIQELEFSISALNEKYKVSEMKRKELHSQLEAYEKNNLEYNKIDLMTKRDKTKQFEEIYKSYNLIKGKLNRVEKELKEKEKQYQNKVEQIDDFVSREIKLNKRISDLKDLVTNLQKENTQVLKNKSILPF